MEVENNKKIPFNLLFSFLIILIIGLVNFAYPIFIGLIYDAETMGGFSVLMNWAGFLSIPIANGIAPAVSRYIAANKKDEVPKFNKLGAKLSLFYLAFALVIYPIISLTLFSFTVLDMFIVIMLFLTFTFHYLFRYSLQGQEKFKHLFKIEIISFCIFIPFMVIFSLLPYLLHWENLTGNIFLFLPVIVYHLAFDVIYVIIDRKNIQIKKLFSFPDVTKKILLYALLVGAGTLFSLGVSQIQIIISDKFVSDFDVGVLGFWDSAIKPIALISVALGAMTIPRITNLRFSKERYDEPFVNSLNFVLTLILYPLFGLIFILMGSYPQVLDILTNNNYNMSLNWLIPILLAFQILNNLLATPTISYYSSSEKKVIYNPIVSFIYSIIVIISWVILVPKFGIFGFAGGIAIGSFFFSVILQVIALVVTKRKIGMHVFVLLGLYLVSAGAIVLLDYWSHILIISLWSAISVPLIGLGIYLVVKLLKRNEYNLDYFKPELMNDEENPSENVMG
ncbi:MAG: hypothetical protein ACTSPK_11115 [Candidatus Heimdallarchaeota archaeon]